MTLDPDVASEIERIRRRDGKRFKVVLNEILRRGLDLEVAKTRGALTVPRDLGTPLVDIVSTTAALELIDDERP